MSVLLGLVLFGVFAAVSQAGAEDVQQPPSTMPAGLGDAKFALFAGGCFWCMESPFEELDGVIDVRAGYAGGTEENPTYEQVSSGSTGHAEAIQIHYDPARIDYQQLLDVYWKQIDPTDGGGQFVDQGKQYRSAIFYYDDEQRRLAQESKTALARSGRFDQPIVTEIVAAGPFFPAEEYHQDYHRKNPISYKYYRWQSGRDQYLQQIWGEAGPDRQTGTATEKERDMELSDDEARKRLTPLQYEVTRQEGTEPPFENEYWNNKAEGIYVEVLSGEPLFSSTDKFDSGTGWPSFTRPLEKENIVERKDGMLFMVRTEVRSKRGDSHLGHVFDDGPEPTGLRYCVNSAALRFVPKDDLEEEGYGQYRKLFESSF